MPYKNIEYHRDVFTISTDPSRLDLALIHSFLANTSYWATGIPYPVFQRSIENSLCFGVYASASPQGEQAGFARVISDYATFAYLADVFILEPFRGQGLSKWLMECILAHPDLQGLRRWCLLTRDAHGLYSQYGFQPVSNPERWMEIRDLQVYQR